MVARLILKHPDSRLRIKSEEVTEEDCVANAKKWCLDIKDTMKANAGLGLAAPQVGIHKRIFAIDVIDLEQPEAFGQDSQDGVFFFINPTLSITEKEPVKSVESCLSVPGVEYSVKRNNAVEISYMTLSREMKSAKISGKDAIVVQHEYDHLEGKLFIDRLNSFDKKEFLKKNLTPKRQKTEGEIAHIREQRRARNRLKRKK